MGVGGGGGGGPNRWTSETRRVCRVTVTVHLKLKGTRYRSRFFVWGGGDLKAPVKNPFGGFKADITYGRVNILCIYYKY